MKILARHLTIDMYKCQTACFDEPKKLIDQMQNLLSESQLEVLSATNQIMPDGHVAIMILFKEGHMTIHAFPELLYISADAFLCDYNADPEKLFGTFRKLFKPEKTKTTVLRRGDFGAVADMKPKSKTQVAPLRKIHNAGSKVIRALNPKKDKGE